MSESKDSSKKNWLKNWFGKQTASASADGASTTTEFDDQFWQSVSSSASTDVRINKLNQLSNIIETTQIERSVAEKLWIETKDLLNPNHSRAVTSAYFSFFKSLVKAQNRQLVLLKPLLYHDLNSLKLSRREDILNVMLIINMLTDQGRNLNMMEQEVSSSELYGEDIQGS